MTNPISGPAISGATPIACGILSNMMNLLRPAFFAQAILALVCTPAAQGTRPLRTKELRGIRLWNDLRVGESPTPGTNDLRIQWDVQFKNETSRELASVSVRLVNELNGRRVFVGKPVEIAQLRNLSIPFEGSILPFNKTTFSRVVFTMPKALWNDASFLHPEFVGASVFTGKKDLHDVGHIFSWMYNHKGQEILAQLKKDPSLLLVRSNENLTMLLMAFGSADPDVVRYVAAHGGSYRDVTTHGCSIMHLAAVGRYPQNLDLALKHGGKLNDRTESGRTPLVRSIESGSVESWKWLLKHGANPNIDSVGGIALRYAVEEGMLQAVKDLIDAGAWKYDGNGQSPMHFAVYNPIVLGQIHNMGFPIDDVDPKFGITPLMIAAWSGLTDPQIWLLKHGADPSRRDRKGRTAYDYCREGRPYFESLVKRFRK